MYKFAHITDCHLGAWRNPKLKEINLKVFQQAISICIDEKVDFIAITGDFFDVSVPELDHVKRAVDIMRVATRQGIEIYMIYGSHDFTAVSVSIIDILHSAGLFLKPVEFERINDKIKLKFIQDKKTSLKITGLSGRKTGLDSEYYYMLDRGALESEEGLKIFLFHAPISELTPVDLAHGESIRLSLLPKGFMYYGGGHLHRRIEHKHDEGKSMIVYPGPLFGSTFTDLEDTAQGERRGFYIISYDNENEITRADFKEVKIVDIIFKIINVNQNTVKQVEDKLNSMIEQMEDLTGKIVLIKITGTLSSGKRSDINFSRFEERLSAKCVLASFINRTNLVSPETSPLKVSAVSIEDIEKKVIKERMASFKIDPAMTDEKVKNFIQAKLISEQGESTANKLLSALKKEKIENETTNDFEKRVIKDGKVVMGLSELANNNVTE
ncbi:MAG: DNA repair exonuclease [Candidatus Nitrosopolaris sp.]